MADHIRKQIRDAAATALTGLTTTGSNVFPSRNHRTRPGDLPGLLIYTKDEDSAPDNFVRPRDLSRELELIVVGRAKDNATLDDTLDLICAEVEAAIGNSTLSSLVKDLILETTVIEFDGDGDAEHGDAVMTWRAQYRTAENDPTAAT